MLNRAKSINFPSPARPQNPLKSGQMPNRNGAEQYQKLGISQLNMAVEKGKADGGLFRRWVTISRRAPIHDIRDVNLPAVEPDRREHSIEQLTGTANEWKSLPVLLQPGCFADEHNATIRVSIGKNGVGGEPL